MLIRKIAFLSLFAFFFFFTGQAGAVSVKKDPSTSRITALSKQGKEKSQTIYVLGSSVDLSLRNEEYTITIFSISKHNKKNPLHFAAALFNTCTNTAFSWFRHKRLTTPPTPSLYLFYDQFLI